MSDSFQSGGLFYALLGAVFVFATGMVGTFFALLVMRNMSVFGKLAIREFGVQNFGVDTQGNFLKEIFGLTAFFGVQNNGARDIHFKVNRATFSVMNQTNQDAQPSALENIVPANQPQRLLLATIEHLKFAPKLDLSRPSRTPMLGKLELEISYGPSEFMPYTLHYVADISFGMSVQSGGKGKWSITLHPVPMIRKYEYKKGHEK